MVYHQHGISSTWYIINMVYHQHGISSTWYIIPTAMVYHSCIPSNMVPTQVDENGISSTCAHQC